MDLRRRVKSYDDFVLEHNLNKQEENELALLLDQAVKMPTEMIAELKSDLEEMAEEAEVVSEGLMDWLNKLKDKFSRWIEDKVFKVLINRKKSFYSELATKLSIFDLSTLDDMMKFFPNFKATSMYLAGGMDEAEDTGAGWRNRLEYEFESEHPGKKHPDVPEAKVGKTTLKPSYVVDDYMLDKLLEDPKKVLSTYYDSPALLNPVRKEVDRNKSDDFDNSIGDFKDPNYDPTSPKGKKAVDFLQDVFAKSIEPDDEHLLRISDAVFLGYDKTAGAGTFGELELLSLTRKPLFVWLVNDYTDLPNKFKLWTLPHLCKVARNEQEMKQLVSTIKRYV